MWFIFINILLTVFYLLKGAKDDDDANIANIIFAVAADRDEMMVSNTTYTYRSSHHHSF